MNIIIIIIHPRKSCYIFIRAFAFHHLDPNFFTNKILLFLVWECVEIVVLVVEILFVVLVVVVVVELLCAVWPIGADEERMSLKTSTGTQKRF